MLKLIILFFLFYSYSYNSVSDEIVQDRNGNYFLMKSDGTFEKLPKPKQGNKYIIKKKKVTKKKKKFSLNQKKRPGQGPILGTDNE